MSRHFLATIVLASSIELVAGCSGYWSSRLRDAADVVTVTAETNATGVRVLLGPWGEPGFYCTMIAPIGGPKAYGLAGGTLGIHEFMDCTFPPFLGFVQSRRSASDERGKDFHVVAAWYLPYLYPQVDPGGYFGGFEGADDWRRLAPRYTQIEVAASLWFGVRFGLNPGELADFIVGWLTFDLYGDDHRDDAAPEGSSNDTNADSSKRDGSPETNDKRVEG